MNDLISRQAAIEALRMDIDIIPYAKAREYARAVIETVYNRLDELPSAQPEWIPCSETVDIPDHEILACDQYGEEMFGYLGYEDEQWMCASEECVMYDPIAWCEKPEPYKERREDD